MTNHGKPVRSQNTEEEEKVVFKIGKKSDAHNHHPKREEVYFEELYYQLPEPAAAQ